MARGDDAADGATPGSQDAPGWTNDHVEPGFDVDGAADRAHVLSTGTRFAVARALYAFLGEAYLSSARSDRQLYPVVRRLGAMVGRRAGAEQRIAENEYLLSTVLALDRPAVGSRPWLLGGALVTGFVLAAVGVQGALFGLLVAGVGPAALFGPSGWLVVGTLGAGSGLLAVAWLSLDRTGP